MSGPPPGAWFRQAAKAASDPVKFRLPDDGRMPVPRPGPDEVVIAACAADGVRAATVVSRATLAEDGIMPSLLKGLEDTQAEVRARREAG